MSLRQRLQLETARELYAIGQPEPADAIRAELAHDLTAARAAEFGAYWPTFVESVIVKNAR
jgi:hypothetical protein